MSQVTNYLVLPASIGLVRAGEVSTGDPSRVLLPILRLRGPETRCSSALSLPLLNMVRLRLQTLFNLRFCQEIRVNFGKEQYVSSSFKLPSIATLTSRYLDFIQAMHHTESNWQACKVSNPVLRVWNPLLHLKASHP